MPECVCRAFQEQARPGRYARRCRASRCRKTQRHRGQQGCRRSASTPSSWHAEVSPTRPEEPSLASVGSGMAAGAAFGHPRVCGARVRPIFLNHMHRKCAYDSCNEPCTGAPPVQLARNPLVNAVRQRVAASSRRARPRRYQSIDGEMLRPSLARVPAGSLEAAPSNSSWVAHPRSPRRV